MSPRALVTGASRGIGKATAIALAEAGFDVAIAARTVLANDPVGDHSMSVHKPDRSPLPGSLEETAQTIRETGSAALPVRMDLTDIASVEAGVAQILTAWGGVDLVVNNGRHVGPGIGDTILDTPYDQFPLFVAAHGLSPVRIAQLVLPGMLERGEGTFVTISSIAGTDFYPASRPGQGGSGLAYRMGKASGHTLVGSLLSECGDRGIRAFNVDPGMVRTERNADQLAELGFDPAFAAPPAAIAAVVAWLATSADADHLMRQDVHAQRLARTQGLHRW